REASDRPRDSTARLVRRAHGSSGRALRGEARPRTRRGERDRRRCGGRRLLMLAAIELGHRASGGFAAMMLASLGADVTRLETPEDRAHDEAAGERARYRRAYFDRRKQARALDLDVPAD